ncbi:hypothetical protein I79_009605 [Cricetulus griseus]|uniref:Uncharacterized protein n=1 Tax=Cricetulus griseus TaxID=10029 RepID=G3HG84_CRIGR|nr:hypothetical protein I79_009605 [Cricetulus griseus]
MEHMERRATPRARSHSVKGGSREVAGEENQRRRFQDAKATGRYEGGRVMAGRSGATLSSVGREGRREPPPPWTH